MKVFYDEQGNRVYELGFVDVVKMMLGRDLKNRVSVIRLGPAHAMFNMAAAPAEPSPEQQWGLLDRSQEREHMVDRRLNVGMPRRGREQPATKLLNVILADPEQ